MNAQQAPSGIGSVTSTPTAQVAPGLPRSNSKRRRLNNQERSAALAKFKEGKNAEQTARELGLPLSNVERLAGKASAGNSGGFASSVRKEDGGLEKALRAAGFDGASPPSGTVPGANPAPQNLPPITPDQLVAALVAVNAMVCRTAATIYRVPMTGKELNALVEPTEEERKALETFAPFAADYAPQVMQQIRPVMAWCFVGACALMTGTRIYEIRERRPKKIEPSKLREAKEEGPTDGQ